jgi:Ca2+-binding EF-hand superfamily protein
MKNMKSLAAAALALVVVTAPAAMAKNNKQKQNGKRGQNDAQIAQGFSRFDTNRDGLIARSEFPADPLLFDRLDANRDGVLSQTEARQFANTHDLEAEARRLDTNRDGRITRDEWRGSYDTFQQLDRNGDGVLSQADRGDRNRTGQRFNGLDRNGDGRVTRSEWRGNDTSFRQHDRNNDGVLSGNELRGGK